MINNQNKFRIKSLYDRLVCLLLIWCVLQDFCLCIILRITGITVVVKLLFYSKDIMLLVLFLSSIFSRRIPVKFMACCLFYFTLVGIQTLVGLSTTSLNIISILSAIRGLILLPALTLIGYGIHDKKRFCNFIKRYYWFLAIIAFIGIMEFIADITVGTKRFWMDSLRLDDFYISIKGASAGLEGGTPGNWYTDIGAGYRTQKRLISIWAAPLTAGFVLLMPCMYYTIAFFKKRIYFGCKTSKSSYKLLWGFCLTVLGLVLTFTRQTLLLYLLFAFFIFVHYRRKNKKVIILGCFVFAIFMSIASFDSIISYLYNGSTMVHIIRLQEAISHMNLLGRGIGSFGTRFAGAIATESYYLTMIGQLGIISLIPYLIMLISPIIYCLKKAKKMDEEKKGIVYSICFCGLIYAVAGLVSETVSAFTSIAQYYVLIGYIWGFCKENARCVRK